jgi:peptidoglycan/xylan/chitin deacetylase (PgdA/CDA1 family)
VTTSSINFDTEQLRAHLDEFVRNATGLPASSREPVPQLPHDLARLLLRAEEYEVSHRDQWGNWEFSFGDNFRRGRLWEPEVDVWIAERRRDLCRRTALEPLWPNGSDFAICLTHDVDLVSESVTPAQALRSTRAAWPGPGASGRERLEGLARGGVRASRAIAGRLSRAPRTDSLELCLGIEREHAVTASYFFTVFPGAGASRFDCVYSPVDACRFRGERQTIADLLRTISGEGFDVGLHGSYHASAEEGLLVEEKNMLESTTGLELTTTRQHFLRWDVRRTARLQAAAGFSADATLGFNRNLGFRSGTALPSRHFDLDRNERCDLLLVPLSVHDTPLLRPDGLELDPMLARAAVSAVVDRIAETGGVATFLFHPNNLARRESEELFRWTINYGLERKAWFASLRDVDRWWREREMRLLTK